MTGEFKWGGTPITELEDGEVQRALTKAIGIARALMWERDQRKLTLENISDNYVTDVQLLLSQLNGSVIHEMQRRDIFKRLSRGENVGTIQFDSRTHGIMSKAVR